MNLRIVTPATAEPLTLGDAMQHMNIDLDDRHGDDVIRRQISAARQAAEEFLCFPLTDAVYEYRLDGFTWNIDGMPWWDNRTSSYTYGSRSGVALPLGRIGSVLSVKYIDASGVEQTLSPSVYAFDDHPRGPVVRLAYGQSWPATRSEANAVRVRFSGVYSETTSPPNPVPESIKNAMGLMLAHWHENREAVVVGQQSAVEVPMGAMYLMQPHRLGMGV